MRLSSAMLWVCMVVGLTSAICISPAYAQSSVGVRAGASVNPDQFYVGGHIQTAPLVDRLRFRPNIELGFGDNQTLVAFNLEFVYRFPSRQQWNLYAGAGPALNYYVVSNSSDLRGGFNFLLGIEHRDGLFFEMKIGAIDSPNLKFGVGYTFK
jgi:hypothetical protein